MKQKNTLKHPPKINKEKPDDYLLKEAKKVNREIMGVLNG